MAYSPRGDRCEGIYALKVGKAETVTDGTIPHAVILVENGSADDSADQLRQRYEGTVVVPVVGGNCGGCFMPCGPGQECTVGMCTDI